MAERWQICDGCGQTWRLPKTPMVHHGGCSSDQWREVMPVSEHEATVRELAERVVRNCACQPSGQTCDRCHPAMVALARLGQKEGGF